MAIPQGGWATGSDVADADGVGPDKKKGPSQPISSLSETSKEPRMQTAREPKMQAAQETQAEGEVMKAW